MRNVSSLNSGWIFHAKFSRELIFEKMPGEIVRLPHNAVDLEMNYFDEKRFQKEFCYQRVLPWRDEFSGKEISLVFDGAMANSVVWLNGKEVARHKDGYTPFEARLTEFLRAGDNLITVKIDGAENSEIPPFGGLIDYLTYAGIYRDVWLKSTSPVSVKNVKIETSDELTNSKKVNLFCRLSNPRQMRSEGSAVAELRSECGKKLFQTRTTEFCGDSFNISFDRLAGMELWDLENPRLYRIDLTISTETGNDFVSTKFGFRTAKFTSEGFFLNGKHLKLRGLNRHQSYPYVGYAMGRRAQEKDAELLKKKLRCNLVRTSHYPQSPHFLNHCDEIGLLVFEEIPGWQFIGGEEWKSESLENVRRMIERDWNHPSIILWGVRINESKDDHDFYCKTNTLARSLDPTRQTGGVRCIENSEFLEDVYTMNDFFIGAGEDVLKGREPAPLRQQMSVTGLPKPVPYMVTEHCGHMYPTKRFDPEHRQAEHVTRHLQVLDRMYGEKDISGAIGWCMNDYNTHKDFGAGDRICHHGVLDIFREPKFAAHAYSSQSDPSQGIVLEPVTYWSRGEKDRCDILPLIILTNCDYVEFQFGDFEPKRIEPDRETYPNLPHPPVIVDSRNIKPELLGEWGWTWKKVRVTGFVNGKAVAEVTMSEMAVPTRLEVSVDDSEIFADEKDATRVIVRALDQSNRLLPFLDDCVSIKISGPGKLLGPNLLPLKGGITGFWIETTGEEGEININVSTQRLGEKRIVLKARNKG